MNYTNYILSGNSININSLISKKRYLKPITITIAIPVAIVGFLAFSGILPATYIIDRVKEGEIKYLKVIRKYKRNKEFQAFLETISDDKEEMKRIKKMYH
jgi:hypothetical protein